MEFQSASMQTAGAAGVLIVQNKKLLQSHIDGAKLGQTPGQHLSYDVWLWQVPMILTMNAWDLSKDLTEADLNWLAENCVVEMVTDVVWEV